MTRQRPTVDPARMRTSNRDRAELHARLGAWFAQTLGPESNPRLSPLVSPGKAGMSSETLLFDMRWRANGAERSGRFVARLPPPADAFPLFPRYDFDMQVGVMRLVGSRSDIAVPRVPWQERGSEALGAPFFVMEHIDGEMVPDNPPYVFGGWLAGATAAQQDTVQQELLRVLAGVHGIEASAEETAFLQIVLPGETPLRRHFARERALYEWGRGGMRFPPVERLFDWLQAHWPASEGEAVLSWGDARPANALWRDFRIVGVLDWELAMLGPREMDVGYLVFFHRYFRHVAKLMAGIDAMPGFLRRDEVVAAYERLTGARLHDIDWYISYALLQQAVVEIRLSQRRILFGEMERPASTDEYLYSRRLIGQVVSGDREVWA
jgi:aminoglycoside phosphotransferase (APT) family kinase protein